MTSLGTVKTVVVVPRNGYANRLQAWASAATMAEDLDAELVLVWEPEDHATVRLDELFETHQLGIDVRDIDWLSTTLGGPHDAFPRYLTVSGEFAVLAGHDRGEQVFMQEVFELVQSQDGPSTLVIIAGGHFHLPITGDFIARRGRFYQRLPWTTPIMQRYETALADHGRFNALHVRTTDRSRDAPRTRAMLKALTMLRSSSSVSDLYIAADTDQALGVWVSHARNLGFQPWSLTQATRTRDSRDGAIDAMAEWLVLARAESLIHPALSTFSTEAAVASGHPQSAVPLAPSGMTQRIRDVKGLLTSAATYQARRRGSSD